jgi:hypothetical protein
MRITSITESRRNLVIWFALAAGVPSGLFLSWYVNRLVHLGFGFAAFVFVVAFLGSVASGYIFWHVYVVPRKNNRMAHDNREG